MITIQEVKTQNLRPSIPRFYTISELYFSIQETTTGPHSRESGRRQFDANGPRSEAKGEWVTSGLESREHSPFVLTDPISGLLHTAISRTLIRTAIASSLNKTPLEHDHAAEPTNPDLEPRRWSLRGRRCAPSLALKCAVRFCEACSGRCVGKGDRGWAPVGPSSVFLRRKTISLATDRMMA